MNIRVEDRGDKKIIHLDGALTLYTSGELHDKIGALIAGSAVKEIIVDLSHVSDFDSAGIGTLVNGLSQSRGKAIEFVLAGAQDKFKDALAVTKLDRVFEVRKSVED